VYAKLFYLLFVVWLISACNKKSDYVQAYIFDDVIDDSKTYFSTILHSLSEEIYDGAEKGTWGETAFGYKMALRDIYWRIEAYHSLGIADAFSPNEYLERRNEALNYLKRIQIVEGDKGVWGMPADFNNPEFGVLLRQIENEHPDYFSNGFLYTLEGEQVAELYYDHGRTLSVFCKVFIDTQQDELLPFIEKGANWILDKPVVKNVNYNAAVVEGLSFAYRATQITDYLDKAIAMTEEGVISQANINGSFGNVHNQEAWYHGFIVSGLLALKHALPEEHSFNNVLDSHLSNSLVYLEQVTDQGSPYEFQWPGINARVWSELEDLSASGKWPALNPKQIDAYANCLYQTMNGRVDPKKETDFNRQKVLYHFIQIGNAIANH
jgi:hypothetical protein